MMMADVMDALGLQGKYIVRVNNRKVLDGVLQAAGVVSDDQKLTVLRAIDKLDKFGTEGVKLLLGTGRKDESGDFTKGAGLDPVAIEIVMSVVEFQPFVAVGDKDSNARDWNERLKSNETYQQGFAELDAMNLLFNAAGYGPDRIKIDPSVVRGLEYYTGPVFEIELTFPVTNEKGEQVVFGSVGGGGRYDGLVSRFRKEPVPATGFSIGVSRLANALKLTGNLGETAMPGPVVVLVMDKEQTPRYQSIVSRLRNAGIRAEMFLGNTKNFGKQVAYADKRNSPAVIIEGTQEREQGIVQIKDLIAGKEAAKAISDNAEWKAERPGQFECRDEDIVARISELPVVRAWLDKNRP
jgi:histidyl-tRNA synthetase